MFDRNFFSASFFQVMPTWELHMTYGRRPRIRFGGRVRLQIIRRK